MLSMSAAVRDTDAIRSDAFPLGKFGNEDRDYISIDFYDYDDYTRDVIDHLRLTIPYEQALELFLKMGTSLGEIEGSRSERRQDAEVTT